MPCFTAHYVLLPTGVVHKMLFLVSLPLASSPVGSEREISPSCYNLIEVCVSGLDCSEVQLFLSVIHNGSIEVIKVRRDSRISPSARH